MSKVTDSWNAFEAATARLSEATAYRVEREVFFAETCTTAEAIAAKLEAAEAGYATAKRRMAEVAASLQSELELVATGRPGIATVCATWANYDSVRDGVSRAQNHVRLVASEGQELIKKRELLGAEVVEAQKDVERAEKAVRDAAEVLRRLIPSEVAGYCGRDAARAGEQVLLPASQPDALALGHE